jgi:phenylalanine ammonia-lyase
MDLSLCLCFSATEYQPTAGNPAIKVHYGDRKAGGRSVGPSNEILRKYNLTPMSLSFKEPLGILNGTAYSAGLGALVVYDAVNLAVLAIVCTAMTTEALHGTRANYDPFIHNIARPHPGQVS